MASLVGQVLDDYRILAVLGRGGMGVVYKATNLALDRPEALKVIAPDLVRDEEFLRRFRLEAQALAKIHHPNIVTVYALRRSGERHYITMEFVEGETLADVLADRGALPWREALPIVRQLLEAFEYAHQKGILHRDIKPRNVMLTPAGRVKVMDFGLAKFYREGDVTQTQGVSGTPYYMAPEQILGHRLDQRSDLFSLGMTIYELLSGRLPFRKDDSTYSIQRSIIENDFPALRSFRSDVPERLARVVMEMLEKDPAGRPSYARDVLKALKGLEAEVAADETVQLPGAFRPVEERRPPTRKRRRWPVALGALLLIAGMMWGATALWPTSRSGPDEPLAAAGTLQADLAETGLDDADPAEAEPETEAPLLSTADETSTPPDQPETTSPRPAARGDRPAAPVPSTERKPEEQTPSTERTPPVEQQRPSTSRSAVSGDAAAESLPMQPQHLADREEPARAGEDAVDDETDVDAAPEEPTTDASAEPAAPEEPAPPARSAAERVQDEARTVAAQLRRAVMDESWASLPAPMATYYRDKLRKLPRKFRVRGCDVVLDPGQVQAVGRDASVPVTLYLTLQQRGRDATQAIPIPSTWQWREQEGRFVLVQVDDR